MIILFQVFLFNTNNSHTVIVCQVFLSNINNFLTYLFDPQIKLRHQMQFSVILETSLFSYFFFRDAVGIFLGPTWQCSTSLGILFIEGSLEY